MPRATPIDDDAAAPISKDAFLTKLFYDPRSGLASAAKLYRRAESKGYTMKQIREFVAKQEISQIHQKPKKPSYFPIFSQNDMSYWQIDLIFYPNTSKINNGYSVILLAIEITTRRCIAVPMKNKAENESLRAGREFLKQAAKWQKVVKITSDLGSEFISHKWAKLMKQHKISHSMVEDVGHSVLGMVNRLCRTIRGLITKYFDAYDTKKWIDALPDLVENYNSSVHSSIKCSPFEAEQSAEIRARIRDKAIDRTNLVLLTKESLQVGDKVRKLKKNALFSKEQSKWTKGTFKINDDANNISSYKVGKPGGEGRKLKHYELKKVPENTQSNPFKRDTSKSFDVATHLDKVRHTKEGVELPKGAPSLRKEAAKAKVLNISDRKSKDYAGQAQDAVLAPKPRKKRKAVVRKPKGSNVFEVESIIRETTSKGKKLFQVRWKGYKPADDTLEPESSLPASLIAKFRKGQATDASNAVLVKRAKSAYKRLKHKIFEDEGQTWQIADCKFDPEFNTVMCYYWDTSKSQKAPPISSPKMEFSPLKEVEAIMGTRRRKRS